jgi:hypothetical protein
MRDNLEAKGKKLLKVWYGAYVALLMVLLPGAPRANAWDAPRNAGCAICQLRRNPADGRDTREDWAWESHDYAVSAVYGALMPSTPAEASVAVHGCSDAHNVGERVLHMHAVAGTTYQEIAGPVVEERIAQAGGRLAMIINAAARGDGASQ